MEDQYEISWDVEAGDSLKLAYLFLKDNISESYAKKFRKSVLRK